MQVCIFKSPKNVVKLSFTGTPCEAPLQYGVYLIMVASKHSQTNPKASKGDFI